MVSKYDVFYILSMKGDLKIIDIVKSLNKNTDERHNIRKKVLELQEEKLVMFNGTTNIIENERAETLQRLIFFCVKNGINYNIFFNEDLFSFIQKAALNEFFTRDNINVHPQTFANYTNILERAGFLLIVSRKPLKCKLLRHHFLEILLNYFKKPVKFYTHTRHSFLPQIKKEFAKFKRKSQLSFSLINEIEKKQEIQFIHMSLSLEGNPITLSDTQEIILKEVAPKEYKLEHIQEITNYKKAVDLMIENSHRGVTLDLALVLKYHGIAMAHIYGAGEIRKTDVRIKGNPYFKPVPWRLLPAKLNNLFSLYDLFEKKKKDIGDIINFAAFFHNGFQRIHPFIDGNSRTSRLLLLHILRQYQLPTLTFPLGYFDIYMDLTKRSVTRDDETFKHLIEEIVFFDLKRINSKLD